MILNINNKEDFYIHLKNNRLNILKIYSDTCEPCKTYKVLYNQLSNKLPNINFLETNIDSKIVKVNAVPTTLIIKDGTIVNKIEGSDINELETKIMENIYF
jgi:thiol-disulfide isomerase/thioredoxin